ncbi:hypothetical protein ACFQWG_05660 [Schaalia naturae]|jgi:hypothetical protein|uniref:DNA-binding protein n=1 Tax=Schaalia naturae TaxID=635203 RepID=A0ABW2SMD3_9ACTO
MRRLTSSERDLLDAIEHALLSRRASAITPETIAQAAHLVRSMTDPRPQMEDLVGPVCTTADVGEWLGITRQGINKAVRENRILAIQSPSTTWYYPTWQLLDDHSVVPQMSQVLGRLVDRVDQLTAARWFWTASAALEGATPARWLTDQRDIHAVVRAAESYAKRQANRQSDRPLYDPEIATASRA